MNPQAFDYDEELFQLCAAHPNDENPDCLSLFNQHQLHYNRLPYPSEISKQIRLNSFLDSVAFVHNHNSIQQRSYFHVTLNQFSDCEQHELPLHDIDFYSLYKADDHHVLEEKKPRVLSGETGKVFQELIRDDLKVNSDTGPVWISASNIRTYRTSKKDDGNKQDGSLVQSHDALGDFIADPMNKDWTQYLNWATADNPDGVSIVHPSSDQVRLNHYHSVMYVVPVG